MKVKVRKYLHDDGSRIVRINDSRYKYIDDGDTTFHNVKNGFVIIEGEKDVRVLFNKESELFKFVKRWNNRAGRFGEIVNVHYIVDGKIKKVIGDIY